MTWLGALQGLRPIKSPFFNVPGLGAKNDKLFRQLQKVRYDGHSNPDMYYHQRSLSREELTAILEARIIRRLT